MKKRTTRLYSALLSVLMLSSATTALHANATEVKDENPASTVEYATGDLSNQMEYTYDGVVIDSAKDYYALKSNGVSHNLIKNPTNLPESIDNSQSKYFPVIGNQGGMGSCVGWAQTYYQFTYAMNKSRGIATTAQNSFSPVYTYSLVCGGDNDMGSGYSDVATLMKETGAAPVSHAPITDDCTNWYADESVRREALKYRIKDYQLFEDVGSDKKQVTSPDDEDLTAIKTALANEEILTFSTEISNWVSEKLTKNSDAPENDKFYNEYVITKQIGAKGGHRMTIVGYNDNIWTDINKNNKIDAGEMGALKIANSWGDGYCNKGFVWFAYDALNKTSCVEGGDVSSSRTAPIKSVMRIDVEPYNSTNLYLNCTLSTADRTTLDPYLIAEKDGTIYKKYLFAKTTFVPNEIKRISFDGSTNTTSGTFLYPLDNIFEDIDSENISDYTWRIQIKDNADDGKSHTLQQAYICDDSTGSRYYPAQGSYPVTVNNNEATVDIMENKLNHAVVYYRGFENPILNYRTTGTTWNRVEMEANIEREGYVHKYVIDLGTANRAILYFSDENGNVDNNKGSYYKAVKDLNYYETENARDNLSASIKLAIDEKFLDVDSALTFEVVATGGYEPYSYFYTTENLDTGVVTTGYYKEYSTDTYFPRSEGNYRLSVNVKDYSGKVITETYDYYVEDRPFEYDTLHRVTSENILVGQEVGFSVQTMHESLQYVGYIKNTHNVEISKNGKVYYSEVVKCCEASMNKRTSKIDFTWTPTESGTYTVKISSTDKKGEYAQTTTSIAVKEFNGTIVGDADNDGLVKITDATLIQKYCVDFVSDSEIWTGLADSDKDDILSIKDATNIQLYLAGGKSYAYVGQVNYKEPEPTTEPTTVAPTTVQPTTVARKNIVTFTNSLHWSGDIKCYYWSNSNTNMTTWPGKTMTYLTTNDYGQKQYTFEVPSDATYVIFTNGSSQTVDIPYGGGEMRYYAKETMSNGAYEVGTW